jgi:aspartyl-tRNA(Asn)/glutamyl-tRNA(Gln) amidotransferase subunit A
VCERDIGLLRKDVVMRAAELPYLSAVDALAAYQAGALSPVGLTRSMLDQIGRYNEQYNAYNLVDAERMLEHTWDFEQRWSHGSPLGVLDRVPAAIKDLILLTLPQLKLVGFCRGREGLGHGPGYPLAGRP